MIPLAAPQVSIPSDALIWASSDGGPLNTPVSRLINRKGGVLLAMRHAAGLLTTNKLLGELAASEQLMP